MGVINDLVTDALQLCDQVAVRSFSHRGGCNQDLHGLLSLGSTAEMARRTGAGKDPGRSWTDPGSFLGHPNCRDLLKRVLPRGRSCGPSHQESQSCGNAGCSQEISVSSLSTRSEEH